MRLLGGVLTILLLLIGSGMGLNGRLQDSSQRLLGQIDAISRHVEAGEWAPAVVEADRLECIWQEEARWWPVLLEHQEMDNIEFALARCRGYIRGHDHVLSMGQLAEIRLMIEHIPRREKVNLENIF